METESWGVEMDFEEKNSCLINPVEPAISFW